VIIRDAAAPQEWRAPERAAVMGAMRTEHLSDVGGVTQFGAYRETLAPGALSSDRHWHTAEDEFLYVLSGEVTVTDNAGDHRLGPGDAAAWRSGVPNAHHLRNLSAADCTYLIVGTRAAGDICHYPDLGQRMVNSDRTWAVHGPDGAVIRQGDLPPALRNLPARPATGGAPAAFPAIIRSGTARIDRPTPEQAARMGGCVAALLSDTGGLTQFGAFTETLMPGSRSGERHWHEAEDEFLYVLDGTPTVVHDTGPALLRPGDACAWAAGRPDAHHVLNLTDRPCTCLIVGSRLPSDRVHYAEVDRLYTRVDGKVSRTRRDGSPL
jgi:uncharacterized cupin superfamily protein